MISEAYVFIDGLEEDPVICGKVVQQKNGLYSFVYGKSYLARERAFPLDPVNLPLSERVYQVDYKDRIHGVLSDAGPDSWGTKVIQTLHTTKPQNTIELLLAGANMGVGALMFSRSRKATKRKLSRNQLSDIDMLLRNKEAILSDPDVSKEAKRAYQEGSFLGGARPKTLVRDTDTSYLVKFNKSDDLFNCARVEHAAMRMLGELGCNVANTRVLECVEDDVLLVERFDLDVTGYPCCHYISANSLMNVVSVRPDLPASHYSYGAFAEILRAKSDEPTDAQELFRRMVFNALIGNTDDHARNHACLYSFKTGHWHLSPAYDVLPVAGTSHAMSIGESGSVFTFENLYSQAERFGLKQAKAKAIIKEIALAVAEWPRYFEEQGVSEGDIERLRGVIPKPKLRTRLK